MTAQGYNNTKRHVHLVKLCAQWLRANQPDIYAQLKVAAEAAFPKMITGAEARRRLAKLESSGEVGDVGHPGERQ